MNNTSLTNTDNI